MTKRPPLTRERVLRAAVSFADEHGLEPLSMRRLGQELGVEAMSLYNHVASKSDLLNEITGVVLGEIELPEIGDWRAAMRRHAVSAHDVLSRHRWAAPLALSPERVSEASVRRADWMLRCLAEGGIPPELSFHAYHALDAHILGFTLWQLGHGISGQEELEELAAEFFRRFPPTEFPHMHAHAEQHMHGFGKDGPGAFELVLDLILDGLERMRESER